jgi:hypothetical protein
MSHVDDGQLNALLDGELPGPEARAVESHVATCADCRRRLEEARAFLHEANSLLDSLSPLAAGTPSPAVPSEQRSQEPARPSRQSVPVRPVGGLADLPGGEAGSVRPPAPPAPKPPLTPAASTSALKDPPRKVMKTVREIAVDIDGRTGMAPGISPMFADEPPAAATGQHARPARRGLDLEKLAWAANIVLALGVGYLANEVRWMHEERAPIGAARAETVLVRQPLRDAVRVPPTTLSRRATGARTSARQTGAARHTATTATTAKPPNARGSKAAPGATRPGAPGDVVSRQPAAELRADAVQGAGASAGAPAPLPSRPQPATAGTNSFGRSRATSLDEPAAAFRPTPGFTRITMEEAVRTLSGSIRQIDGMTPTSIESGGGRLVAGSDASREVVRVNYSDQYGRRFALDQQLAEPRAGPAFNGIMPGDTLVASAAGGGSRVRWLDGKFWLSLSGPVPGNEIRALVGRVR